MGGEGRKEMERAEEVDIPFPGSNYDTGTLENLLKKRLGTVLALSRAA